MDWFLLQPYFRNALVFSFIVETMDAMSLVSSSMVKYVCSMLGMWVQLDKHVSYSETSMMQTPLVPSKSVLSKEVSLLRRLPVYFW